MPSKTPCPFKPGDLVRIVGYSSRWDGAEGLFTHCDNTIGYFEITDPANTGYRKCQSCAMYLEKLELVDNSAMYIPEDWS